MKPSRQAFSSSLVSSLACCAAFLVAGCATARKPAPVAAPAVPSVLAAPAAPAAVDPVFAPVATAKAAMVGSLVSVAPSTLVSDLDALSQRLGLPMQAGQEMVASLASLGLVGDATHFRQVWDALDASTPVAVVWVLPPKAEAKGYCAALTFHAPSAAQQALRDLGAPGASRDGVVERKVASGDSVWATVVGKTLLVSNSDEALLLGGALAQQAQRAPKEGQLVLSVLPQALAKASGQSNEQIVARITGAMTAAAQSAGNKTAAGTQKMVVAGAREMAKMALEAAEVRLVIEASAKAGILLRAEVSALPGSELATRIARRSSYAFDDRLPIHGDRTVVMAVGDVSPWLVPLAQAFDASGPAGVAMHKDMTRWFELVGDLSCVVDPLAVGFTTLCSSSLKPGADAKKVLDAAVALLSAQNAWEAELEGRKAAPFKIKRGKDGIEVEKKIASIDPTARAVAKAMAGGDSVKSFLAVKAGRLVQATGLKARQAVAGYGAPAEIKDAPIVAAALAGSKGMEGVASVDVVAFLLKLLGKSKELPGNQMATMAASLPGVATLEAPFLFEVRTGDALTADFRIPLGSLDNIGKVVQGVLGGAPAPAR